MESLAARFFFHFAVTGAANLTSLSAPSLATVGGNFLVDNNRALAVLDVAITSLTGTFKTRGDDVLSCTDVDALVCAIDPNPLATSVDTNCTPDATCVD